MPSTGLLVTFLITTAVFAYVPGPAMLYATAQTIARGRWSGVMATLGIHLGGYVHVAAAAAGLSALFHAVPTLYLTVKLAGAAYLIWMGVSLFRARAQADVALPEVQAKSVDARFSRAS
jgi:threonine/homoserine/homoserine lactone efflux protein